MYLVDNEYIWIKLNMPILKSILKIIFDLEEFYSQILKIFSYMSGNTADNSDKRVP